MLVTLPHVGSPVMFLVTLVQSRRRLLVFHTRPSLVPAQIRPFLMGEGAIAKTTSP